MILIAGLGPAGLDRVEEATRRRLLDPALALLAGMGIRGIEPDSRRLLASDEAAYITGQVLSVDGGMVMG